MNLICTFSSWNTIMRKFYPAKALISVLLILSLSQIGKSQVYIGDKKYLIETSAMVGWLFSTSSYASKMHNNPIYTIAGAYIKNERVMYELTINTISTSIHYKAYNGYSDTTARYSQTYVMFGIVKTFNIGNPKFQPFFSTSFGFINRSVQVVNVSPETQLAVGLQGGIKYFVKGHYGVKLQARLQSSINGFGIGVGFGSAGPSVGVGSYSNGLQIDFSGGMFYRF